MRQPGGQGGLKGPANRFRLSSAISAALTAVRRYSGCPSWAIVGGQRGANPVAPFILERRTGAPLATQVSRSSLARRNDVAGGAIFLSSEGA